MYRCRMAPAKRASKVSPVAAVSGNTARVKTIRHTANTLFERIETILGINHAVPVKKNLILMTGSFALSIIMFLSFSVFVDLVNYLMPQSVATSDIEIASDDGNTIPHDLLISIQGMDERQVTKMIAAEAATYAVLGYAAGCIIGMPLSKLLYDFLIAKHFPYAVWHFPLISLAIILLFVSLAAIVAFLAPANRIRSMPITATINEL